MDEFIYIHRISRLTTIHVENELIEKAFREEIRMKLTLSCQFLALKGHPFWMHHFISKLFVLHSHSNRSEKAQASFRVLRRMEANIRNTFYPSIQIFWDCFFSSFPHIHSNKRRHYITFLTNKSSEFYSAFAVRAALNIFTCLLAILLIIIIS